MRTFVEVLPRAGTALRTGFLAADFLVTLRGRAAVEARFLVLPLILFAFRGLSGVAAAASLTAPAAVDTTSLVASTVALAASVTISCADFAASTVALGASAVASCVALRTPYAFVHCCPLRASVQ